MILKRGSYKIFVLLITAFLFSVNIFSNYEWRPLGAGNFNGTNGHVYAIVQYNGKIVVAGGFSNAGGVNVNNIAQWNPATSIWSPVGAGLNDTVYALYVYNSRLYAAGYFTMSGTTSVNRIASWNDTSWQALGSGLDDEGRALYQFGNDLIVGGNFNNVGNGIAKWNGSSWSPLGAGVDNRVFALTVYNSQLIAAGRFTNPGNNIAGWNGSSWSPLGLGTDDRIFALTVYNSELIAGGRFNHAGSITAYDIAKWNGSVWSSVGNYNAFYEENEINALTVFNGNLLVGGGFHFCDTIYVSRVTSWNGALWAKMSTGSNDRVKAFYVFGSDLYSGGEFSTAGGRYINHVARWTNDPVVTIQGQVRYADNNQLVASGKIQVLRLDVFTREVIIVDSVHFTNGTYLLPNVSHDSTDRVIALPDDELDYVPTYHPSAIDWRNAVQLVTYNNLTNINISVYRVLPEPQNPLAATIGGRVYLNTMTQNPPANNYPYWSDAVVYVKTDTTTFKRFAISGTDRSYRTSLLNPGTYQLFVSRFGFTTATRSVTVGATNLDSINFYLDSLNIIGLHNISSNVPKTFLLKQNYPNPFNPVTTISFALPFDGLVQMKIYDVLGREVALLVNEFLRKGEYKYVFGADNLTSGVYFYNIKTDGYSETKKMVLIK